MSSVQSAWQQAQNLINQQVQVLVQQLWEKDQKIRNLETYKARADAEIGRLTTTADEGTYSWYEQHVNEERVKRYEAEALARKRLEFMKLKDRAKIKVEITRDRSLRRLERLESEVEELRNVRQNNRALREANQRQAEEFARLQKDNGALMKRNGELLQQVEGLQDVLKLGRRGIEAEWTQSRQRGGW